MSASDHLNGQQFFHTSGHDFAPGDRVRTFHELHGEDHEDGLYVGDHAWRADRVWMHDQPVKSPYTGGGKVYEVHASPDVKLHLPSKLDEEVDLAPDEHGYVPQFHARSARVVRRVL